MTTLGFIGTGGMGQGMAANLIKAGYSVVVNDLNREQAKGLEEQGAQFVDTPKGVAESCDIVLSMLPNNDAVTQVGLGAGGLAEATGGAKLWIEFSSIDKATIVGASDELGKTGWTVVDVGTGGVEEVAAAGQLALSVSGEKNLFDEHQPIFEPMAKSILHVRLSGVWRIGHGVSQRVPGGRRRRTRAQRSSRRGNSASWPPLPRAARASGSERPGARDGEGCSDGSLMTTVQLYRIH